MDTWAEVLHDVTNEELIAGFEALDDEAPEFPPSVMEFKRMCRPQGSKTPPEAHQAWVSLPKPKSDREKALQSLANMRKAMTRNKPA